MELSRKNQLPSGFRGGVHPGGEKELTKDAVIEPMPAPAVLFVPVKQHMGKDAVIKVGIGDAVKRGQLIAAADGVVSSNIFSPVSGTVKELKEMPVPGGYGMHIVIENDFKGDEELLEPLTDPDAQAIITRARDAGIVGLGGAGFPTAVKLKSPDKIDTLIINAAECEPYITCDYRILIEKTDDFLKGALLLKKASGAEKLIIGIENNKPDAIKKLRSAIADGSLDIDVMPLATRYPQGAEKQLIYMCTGKTVKIGDLPSSVGVVVNNVHTALSLYYAVAKGVPLYSRVMTVSGLGIKHPKNLLVSTGTLFSAVIEFCGGRSAETTVKMLSGGPMMGIALDTDNSAVTKTTSSLLMLTKSEAFTGESGPCINCGKCARACPMRLMPMYIDLYTLAGDLDNAVKYGARTCIECGCCAYTCPAKRQLVQSIRLAKKKLSGGAKR